RIAGGQRRHAQAHAQGRIHRIRRAGRHHRLPDVACRAQHHRPSPRDRRRLDRAVTRRIVAMPTLLIADDHPLFRAALRGAAADAVDDLQVFEADSLDSVLAALEAEPGIDLVLLDLHMPGNHGLAGLAAIRAQHPGVAVVVVSANDDPRVIRRALDHGAAGYLPKSTGLEDLREAIRAVLGLQQWLPPALRKAVDSATSLPGDA